MTLSVAVRQRYGGPLPIGRVDIPIEVNPPVPIGETEEEMTGFRLGDDYYEVTGSGGGGGSGGDGWTPVIAVVTHGARRVLQVSDWVGGDGTKPATGQYVGASGLVNAVADAVDIRGDAGADGADGALGRTGAMVRLDRQAQRGRPERREPTAPTALLDQTVPTERPERPVPTGKSSKERKRSSARSRSRPRRTAGTTTLRFPAIQNPARQCC